MIIYIGFYQSSTFELRLNNSQKHTPALVLDPQNVWIKWIPTISSKLAERHWPFVIRLEMGADAAEQRIFTAFSKCWTTNFLSQDIPEHFDVYCNKNSKEMPR